MVEPDCLKGMLSPYRVLDLSDEKGLLCGKLLGDLGADVIKVERPGGDPARYLGPFFHDEVDPEKSLFWFAYNTSKRGITLDMETATGRELFRELLGEADLVIESFPPGYLDGLGLGYAALEKINPGVVVVSITPFGQTGPYRDYKAPDIVACAMGGQSYALGDLDRPPVRMGHHSQAHLSAAAEAAVGAMLALLHRRETGEGQQVDVSIQESVIRCAYGVTESWDMVKASYKVEGPVSGISTPIVRVWRCKDGHVMWVWFGGPNAGRWNLPLVRWMDDEGMADDFLRSIDWDTFSLLTVEPETADRLFQATRRFFMTHTKAELLEGAVSYHVMLYPMATAADTVRNVQLAARHFWVEMDHPELGTAITYPGAFARSTEAPPMVSRRAPLIGEHNQAINGRRWLVQREEPPRLRPAEYQPAAHGDDSPGIRVPGKLLEGVRVLDFSRNIAGPMACRTLASFGAEVIKIESERRHDSMRMAAPFKDGIAGLNRGGRFNQHNSGKRSLALNLAHAGGLKIAKRLVARSDVVLEN
ncbi:MAG: CoA transferase, partial [Dehalococcoidia bacterium]